MVGASLTPPAAVKAPGRPEPERPMPRFLLRSTTAITPVLSGGLIAFIDAFALLMQAQFLMATYERMRQPLVAELATLADGVAGQESMDLPLVTVSLMPEGIYIDDEAEAVALDDLAGRLAPLADAPGTAFLHIDATVPWATVLAVQATMTAALGRNIVAPVLR